MLFISNYIYSHIFSKLPDTCTTENEMGKITLIGERSSDGGRVKGSFSFGGLCFSGNIIGALKIISFFT